LGHLKQANLGGLSGPTFHLFRRKKKAQRKQRKEPKGRLCLLCFREVVEGEGHLCQASTMAVVDNLVEMLPEEVTAKVAHSYLARQVEGGGDQVLLPPAAGGHPLLVSLGHREGAAEKIQISHQEVQTMKAKAGVSGNQMDKILADFRAKAGRKIVKPGARNASRLHNKQYSEFFTAGVMEFEDNDGKPLRKPFVYCSSYSKFIEKVEGNRGVKGKARKIGGDSGKGFFKLTLTLYDEDVEGGDKKKRRKRKDGVTGGEVEETGQSMILLLAVVPGIPETAHNIWSVLQAVGVNCHPYKITGDLKFLMQLGCRVK